MKTATLAALTLAAGTAAASPVQVEIHGDVYFNGINSGTLSGVTAGETCTYSFTLDSEDYMNGSFPTRGYVIDTSSFALNFSGGTTIGLAESFSGPLYFVVRHNDPAVDGFFISAGLDFPSDTPLDQAGRFGDFGATFSVSYVANTLSSFDILDAAGYYDFTGLKVFGMGINDGPIESVLGIDFNHMTITAVPAPSAAALLGLGGLVATRRRR